MFTYKRNSSLVTSTYREMSHSKLHPHLSTAHIMACISQATDYTPHIIQDLKTMFSWRVCQCQTQSQCSKQQILWEPCITNATGNISDIQPWNANVLSCQQLNVSAVLRIVQYIQDSSTNTTINEVSKIPSTSMWGMLPWFVGMQSEIHNLSPRLPSCHCHDKAWIWMSVILCVLGNHMNV